MRSFTDRKRGRLALTGVICAAVWLAAPAPVRAQPARQLYTSALARERTLRDVESRPTLKRLRAAANSYMRVVTRYPRSAYSDNALWQASGLYALAFERYHDENDRRSALGTLARLRREYPSSSLIARTDEITRSLRDAAALPQRTLAPSPVARASLAGRPRERTAVPAASLPGVSTLLAVRRMEVGGVVRVTIELDSEVMYAEERLSRPARVFFDLKNVKLGEGISEVPLTFEHGIVRQVRIGKRGDTTTRIAMDLDGVSRYSVFALYNPYRLVVDFEAAPVPSLPLPIATSTPKVPLQTATAGASDHDLASAVRPPSRSDEGAAAGRMPSPSEGPASAPVSLAGAPAPEEPPAAQDKPLPSVPAEPSLVLMPSVPSANGKGGYSIARQLGLGVARVVVDPGHGGRDPGASSHRVTEAELVLDVALRLEKLLQKERGMEVVLTRRTDVFIPLEERTAIANRAGADLFLSIHANASGNAAARGVETYYLNFATNSEAAAVAARENSASSRTMHALPDILKAIALNDKLDESRDFAELVQQSMLKRLRPQNSGLRNLGVKRAPFVVLIGAGMPSVLAEISFVTNKQEATLLRTGAYRQKIAQALHDAITQYQRALKRGTAIADSAARQ